jgi:hypothetical protein
LWAGARQRPAATQQDSWGGSGAAGFNYKGLLSSAHAMFRLRARSATSAGKLTLKDAAALLRMHMRFSKAQCPAQSTVAAARIWFGNTMRKTIRVTATFIFVRWEHQAWNSGTKCHNKYHLREDVSTTPHCKQVVLDHGSCILAQDSPRREQVRVGEFLEAPVHVANGCNKEQ